MGWRGYVIANKGRMGRVAMRDSGKTFATKAAAIKNMKGDNNKWMKKNYSPEWVEKANFEYGAVPDGKFKDGSQGNKSLLKWHDATAPCQHPMCIEWNRNTPENLENRSPEEQRMHNVPWTCLLGLVY